MKPLWPFLLILLAACEQEVTIDLPESDPQAVVNCILDADSVVDVQVFKSRKLFSTDSAILPIRDASVSMWENGQPAGPFSPTLLASRGYYTYRSAWKPKPGSTYSLLVNAPGFPSARGEVTIPNPPKFSFTSLGDSAWIRDNQAFDVMKIELDDPANEANYYEIAVWANDTMPFLLPPGVPQPPSIYRQVYLESDDPYITGASNGLGGGPRGNGTLVFTDETLNGKNATITFRFRHEERLFSDSMILEVTAINKPLFQYKVSYEKQLDARFNPFAEPARVFSNISGGVGLLGARCTQKVYIRVR